MQLLIPRKYYLHTFPSCCECRDGGGDSGSGDVGGSGALFCIRGGMKSATLHENLSYYASYGFMWV